MSLERELKFAKRLAREARDIIVSFQRPNRLQSQTKKDHSVVTSADIAVKNHIVDEVRKEFPDYGLLVEERDQGARQNRNFEYIWVWDPLDGSGAFESLYGTAKKKSKKKRKGKIDVAYGTLGGLLKKFDEGDYEPVLGVSLNVPKGEMICAAEGEGAYVVTENGSSYKINSRARKNFSVDIVVSTSRKTEELEGLVEILDPDSVRPMTSSFKALEVIKGRATLYPCPKKSFTHIWDLVAIDAIFREYGAAFTDIDGDVFNYWDLVKNARNHKGILAGLNEVHALASTRIEDAEFY